MFPFATATLCLLFADGPADPLPEGAVLCLQTGPAPQDFTVPRQRDGITGLGFSAGGRVLYTADNFGPVRRWDAATGKRLPGWGLKVPWGERHFYHFDPAGRYVARVDQFEVHGEDGTVSVYDPDTGRELFSVPTLCYVHHCRPVFSADGTRFVTVPPGVEDPPIMVWDVKARQPVTLEQPGTAYLATLSADGSILAAETREDGREGGRRVRRYTLCTWDVHGRRKLAEIDHPERHAFTGMAIDRDGDRLAVTYYKTLTVYDCRSGRVVCSFETGSRYTRGAGPVFSPDGRTVAIIASPQRRPAADGFVEVWEVASGQMRHRFRAARDMREIARSLTFRPDGDALATGDRKLRVYVWDLRPDPPEGLTVSQAWDLLDTPHAYGVAGAMSRLLAEPEAAVRFLSDKLEPAPRTGPGPDEFRGWVADLDSAVFARREAATARLIYRGHRAEPYLSEALAGGELGPEGDRRVRLILRRLGPPPKLSLGQLRSVRSVEVLERLARDSEEARELLARLSEGDPTAVLTREAAGALRRLPE